MLKELFLSFLMCISLFAPQLHAQEKMAENYGGGGLLFGYGHFPVSDLAVFVPQAESFNEHHFLFGASSQSVYKRVVVGFEVVAAFGDTYKNDSLTASVDAGWMNINFGYVLLDKARFKIYPTAGAGVILNGLSMSDKRQLSLQQIQNDFGREINLSRLGMSLDIGVNIDLLGKWKYHEETSTTTCFLTGLKIGYLYSFAGDNWKYGRGTKVSGGPDFGLHGPYLQLKIGGYSTRK